jgi:hypothetical protein
MKLPKSGVGRFEGFSAMAAKVAGRGLQFTTSLA